VQRFRQALPVPAARMSNVPPARGPRWSDLPVSGSDRRERYSRRLVRSRCCGRGRGSGQHGSCQHPRRKYPSGARCYQRPRCRRCAGSQPLPHTILMLIPVHDHYPHLLNTGSHHTCHWPTQTLAGKGAPSRRRARPLIPASTVKVKQSQGKDQQYLVMSAAISPPGHSATTSSPPATTDSQSGNRPCGPPQQREHGAARRRDATEARRR